LFINNNSNNIPVNHQAMELAEEVKMKLETFLALTTDGGEWSAIYCPHIFLLPSHFRHSDGSNEDM
jgi:hypothetical protein